MTDRKPDGDQRDERFREGDRVSWRSHGEAVPGAVVDEITEDTRAAGRTVRASPERPQYRVRSAKTGRDAVHKPGALRRR